MEIAGNFKHPLKTLIAPYATETSSEPLRYDDRQKPNVSYKPVSPERVAADLVEKIRSLTQSPNAQPNDVESALFAHFCERCGDGQAIKVAASLIAHNTGAYYKLDEIDTTFNLPFTMNEPVQRRLLRAAAQFEHDRLDEGIKRQEEDNAQWEGLPKLKIDLQDLSGLLAKIDEREGTPVTQGQLA